VSESWLNGLNKLEPTTGGNDVLELLSRIAKTQAMCEVEPCPFREESIDVAPTTATRITTYGEALKYVVKYTSKDEDKMARIRDMIQDQKRREQQWYDQRQSLIQKQQTRHQQRDNLNSILSLVGASQPNSSTESSAEEDAKELARYDDRVYREALIMMENQLELLREMSIPLFCGPQSVDKQEQQRLLVFLSDLAD
jgi:hypothetical protein